MNFSNITLSELRAAATEHGLLLVHRDRIRTMTATLRMSKMDIHKRRETVPDRVREQLARHLAELIVQHEMITLQEIMHEWQVEFRADLEILGPKSPHPESQEFFVGVSRHTAGARP